jgi:type I restriction enzyme S subunit
MQADTEFAFLGDIADFEMGQSPDSSFVNDAGIGIPFLQGNAEFGPVSPTHRSYCSRPKKLCRPGDVLISVRAPVGALNKADRVYCIGRGLAAIGFHGVLPDYGWRLLNYWAPNLRIVAQGTTFEAVGKTELLSLRVVRLPEPEQRRIADILDAADAAIRQTDALIAKLKQIKAGLLHDLLTRGLDAHGRLRDPAAHPEQFKESPVGRIPREWEVVCLVDRISFPRGQLDPRQEPYRNWPLIAPDHIESGTGRLLAIHTAAEQNAISGKYGFEPGDVLYSKIRPYLRKAVLADRQGLCSADMYPLRPGPLLVPRFLLALVLSERFSQFATAVSMRSGFPKINREELAEYTTALPARGEQERIAAVLDAHDARIRAEETYRDKLAQVKKGLMEDLLTGRVRVA